MQIDQAAIVFAIHFGTTCIIICTKNLHFFFLIATRFSRKRQAGNYGCQLAQNNLDSILLQHSRYLLGLIACAHLKFAKRPKYKNFCHAGQSLNLMIQNSNTKIASQAVDSSEVSQYWSFKTLGCERAGTDVFTN